MLRKLAVAALFLLAVPSSPGAHPAVTAPQSLRAFLLRADEPGAHVFSRPPSFTWQSVRAAGTYEFQLSMSQTFDDSQILFRQAGLTQPAVAVPLQLPWMTGEPFALWAHVRFRGADGHMTPWSEPFGFNM